MDKYYYLTSSLPLLKFTEKPHITRRDLITEAGKWLVEEDFMILSRVDINDFLEHKKGTPLLRRWKEFEYSLREEIRSFRRAEIKKAEFKIRKELVGIFQEDKNPLQIERELLLLRWNFLEEKEAGHFFDLDFLIIYCLKLQVLERLFSFDKEKGKERFESLSEVK